MLSPTSGSVTPTVVSSNNNNNNNGNIGSAIQPGNNTSSSNNNHQNQGLASAGIVATGPAITTATMPSYSSTIQTMIHNSNVRVKIADLGNACYDVNDRSYHIVA